MKLSQFFKELENNREKELVFEFDQKAIRKDYHIAEILSTQVKAIDCGGALDQWSESVFQLIEPRYEDGERFMETQKALGILKKSHEKLTLDLESKVILEFRPEKASAAQRFEVSEISADGAKLRVTAAGSMTQCKALDRVTDGATACCGPKKEDAAPNVCCG